MSDLTKLPRPGDALLPWQRVYFDEVKERKAPQPPGPGTRSTKEAVEQQELLSEALTRFAGKVGAGSKAKAWTARADTIGNHTRNRWIGGTLLGLLLGRGAVYLGASWGVPLVGVVIGGAALWSWAERKSERAGRQATPQLPLLQLEDEGVPS
ncbi:MAG: hypothetical protein ACRELB_23410 [Polyangiaceae bacterium]